MDALGITGVGGPCLLLKDSQRPCITDGCAGDGGAVLGPGWDEERLEDVPENENIEIAGVACFGQQVIWTLLETRRWLVPRGVNTNKVSRATFRLKYLGMSK